MSETPTRDEILTMARAVAADQAGGTLATTHAEDGTPYVTFVLFHLRENGEVLFGSGTRPQHTRNILATPEVSFLIDNREVIRSEWTGFNRVVIEGRASEVAKDAPEYAALIDELGAKNKMAGIFTDRGLLFRITPRRLIFMRGFEPGRLTIDFEEGR